MDVLGVGITAANPASALSTIDHWIAGGERHYVCFTGVHGVIECQGDPNLTQIHNESGMTLPDGRPMVWAGRFAGVGDIRQVCGPEFLPLLAEHAAERGLTSFLYGGAPGTAELLASCLSERFAGLRVVGTHAPPFRPLSAEERRQEFEMINRANPDLVWVGLSTPKQERWMAGARQELEAPVLLGVGAAFDINAGLMKRAPHWMSTIGLE